MIELAVSKDKVLEKVPKEIELDVSNVGNMTTLPKIVQTFWRQKKIRQNKCSKCLIQKGMRQH